MKIIKTGIYGIEVELDELTDDEIAIEGEHKYLRGWISSDLHEDSLDTTKEEIKNCGKYNAMIDAIESIILAHAIAGIDITTPAYLEGIETAVDGCAHDTY